MPTDRQAAARFRAAHAQLTTAAVTGTNGKTTTVSMIAAIAAASGRPAAKLTTVGAEVAGRAVRAGGGPSEFLATVERAVAAGVSCLALEVTSKALAGGLARRWPARCAVFTNLTRDHLDMHGSPEAYLAAKAQLFVHLSPQGTAVLNADDPASALIDEVTQPAAQRLWFGSAARADLVCRRFEVSRAGTVVHLGGGELAAALSGALELSVIGDVHGKNAMAAALACHALGYAPETIRRGLRDFAGVPGRFEVVAREPFVVIDYAHSPDGLRTTLATARVLLGRSGRLICVFGCGGERDRGKRPLMGETADRLAHQVILTSDNPRRESPEAIADSVQAGSRRRARWMRQLDRPRAVVEAIHLASPEDVVVIAGKGHESVQEVMAQRIHMSDRELALSALGTR